ncbi:GPW/gp25 family protein [Frankia gtarii]|uniref:GPW/gp25 family protein n=1 Tax=Frankia gtarii TaxID=2950102 RepID=UPI0021C20E7E|nr:GPW/gp25 family protein [Frankia gtarii]
MAANLGVDLALTRYVPVATAAPLDFVHSWGALDLAVAPRRVGTRVTATSGLATVSGRANLAQALITRLLTPRASLAALGHPGYGSRLAELVGRRNDAAARDLARLYVIEALDQEPRATLRSLTVRADPDAPDVVLIAFTVAPLGDPEPLGLSLELAT